MDFKLEYPYPVPFAVPGLSGNFLLKLKFVRLVVEEDLDLMLTVRASYYTSDEGAFGMPVADFFEAQAELSADQKARFRERFRPFEVTASTRGVMIDPATGLPVAVLEDGTFPQGSVPEKMAWLTMDTGQVPTYPMPPFVGESAVSRYVFSIILLTCARMVNNKRL